MPCEETLIPSQLPLSGRRGRFCRAGAGGCDCVEDEVGRNGLAELLVEFDGLLVLGAAHVGRVGVLAGAGDVAQGALEHQVAGVGGRARVGRAGARLRRAGGRGGAGDGRARRGCERLRLVELVGL